MVITGLITLMLLMVGPGHGEANLKSYPRITAPSARDRILIIAPHIDDESIGAAGFAADAIANGADVYIAFLTAGDCNRFSALLVNKTLGPTASGYLTVGRTRIKEAKVAMTILGVPADHYFILGYPDQGLRAILEHRGDVIRSRGTKERSVPYDEAMSPGSPYSFATMMADVERVVAIAKPTIVIAPVNFDQHPDHAAAAQITDMALTALDQHPHRLGYLVHSSAFPALLRIPERALKPPVRMRGLTWATYPLTTAVQKQKDAILQIYKSQRPYTSILRNQFVRKNELFFVPAALPLHADRGSVAPRADVLQ
jgi:LmbE family N-acetylglucosaminyl deacetylase